MPPALPEPLHNPASYFLHEHYAHYPPIGITPPPPLTPLFPPPRLHRPITPSATPPISDSPFLGISPTLSTTSSLGTPQATPSDKEFRHSRAKLVRPRQLFPDVLAPAPLLPTPSQASPPPPLPDFVLRWRTLFNYHHQYVHRYEQPARKAATLSDVNIKANLPWGDPLLLSKPSHIFRLYFQNVNGIRLDAKGGDLVPLCSIIHELSCDVVGFAEVKLDVTKYSVKSILYDTFRSQFQSIKLSTSTSPIPFEGFYKPGGTLLLTVNEVNCRYRHQYQDSLGRWSTISMNGRHNRIVHFISIYQVVDKATSGPYTAYQQQNSALRLADRDVTPRQAFIQDFYTYLTGLKTPETQFVVMGDFNEVVGLDISGFASITRDFDLVDIHGHYHSNETEVPTYARGTTRLDFVFCSAPLLPAVEACGIEPFNQHIFSDHRALFVDWDTSLLFGSATPTIVSKAQRRLQTSNAQTRSKYITYLHKYCEDHRITSRLAKLHEAPDPVQAEAIDRDITRGMLAAEKQCRHMGPDPWSILLQQARLKVEIFKHAHSMAKTGLDHRPKIDKLLARHTEPIDIPNNVGLIHAALRQAQSLAREITRHAAAHRKAFLAQQAALAFVQNDKRSHQAYKLIAKAEETKAMYAKLRFIRSDGTQQTGLTRLEVPQDPAQDPKHCTEWTTVDTPADITKYLLERNQKHFGQAAGTPFTVPPLSVHVDFRASTNECDLILNGDYDTSTLDDLTSLLLKQFTLLTELDVLPSAITEQAMLDKYRFWPEGTSTSPSGRHLGHYRTLLPGQNYPPISADAKLLLDTQRSSLATIHHSVTQYALENNHSYYRWQKVVNVMLEKEPGNPKIHRLRVIHLYEADYNLILGVKWRELIHHCEDNHLIHRGLFGTRPGRSALDPVFMEEIIADITRMTRKPLIKNTDDATACYDRIIPGVGNLASRSHGLHRNIAFVQGATLETVRYHLKTQLGVTDEHYQHCVIYPIYGTGQGSGNSPTIWLVVSSALFICYDARAFGARFETPDRSLTIDIYRVGFVDDTTSYVNQFMSDTAPTPAFLISLLTHDSQLWSDLLWKSGGGLELPKCTYHFWYYSFMEDGCPFLIDGQVGPPVVLVTGDGLSTATVPHTSVYTAYKTLGCWKAPGGAQTKQYEILLTQCQNHARIISTSALTRREAWTYYFSMYLTSVGYSLPVCHFTFKQLEELEKQILPAIIAKCGYNRYTSRAVLCGPSLYTGGNFRPLATEQGVGQLLYFLKHWTQPLDPGQLLRISVAWAQINVGVSYSIFADVTPKLQYFEALWLKSVRTFLRRIGGSLRLDKTYIPAIQRINDTFIMDHVLETGYFTPIEVRRINYCRLYLQAVTVSDISTPTGISLAPGIENGQSTLWTSRSQHHYTNQSNPSPAVWKLWKKAMRLFSNKDGSLHVPLRQWLQPPSTQRRQWTAYFDPINDVLLFRYTAKYEIHTRHGQLFNFTPSGIQLTVPDTAYPVSVIEFEWGWRIESYSSYCPRQTPLPPSTFDDYCTSLEPWESQLLSTVTLHYDPFTIAGHMMDQPIRTCSDGSAAAFEGTYGWVLSLADGTRLAHGAGPVDGHDPRSFRSEGQGMLSIVCLLHQLYRWTRSDFSITGILATDNSGLLTRITKQRALKYPIPNSVFQPDWDVVQAIVQVLGQFPIDPTFQHVAGHQDDDQPLHKLSLLATLNVEADEHAGKYRQEYGTYRPLIPLSPTRPIALDIDGKTVHRKYKQTIRDAERGPDLAQTMQLRYEWPVEVFATIDWEVHRQAVQQQISRKIHYVKLCHEMLPIGKLVHRYKDHNADYCPLCRTPREVHQHVLRCLHPDRVKWRATLLESLRKKCYALRTDPILRDILLIGLTAWLAQTPFPHAQFPASYQRLLHEQQQIGWSHIFQGRMTLQWAYTQQDHLNGLPPIKGHDGHHWTRSIIGEIFKHWNDLWDSRNGDRHGKDTTTKAQVMKTQAHVELDAAYLLRDKVLHRDRHLFHADIATHRALPTRVVRQWLNTFLPVLLKSCKDAKVRSLLNVRSLATYFPTRTRPPRPPKPPLPLPPPQPDPSNPTNETPV